MKEWNNFSKDKSANITVVLTAYKRIDTLRKQLQAIKDQTLKPDEIWLFQDKVACDYTITIEDELLAEFNNVYIAKENIGVWGRFEFAKSAGTKYVCVFDDDTIPGKRWLENCYSNSKKEEGIYGTIGIVLFENTTYPQEGYCRIGWHRPNEIKREVDFVGHSWFFQTKWLDYMFTDAIKMRKYKYAAEDMSLSYAASLHGIKTFVPEHPCNNRELWGSQPETALIIGNDGVSLSGHGNWERMNRCIIELIDDGWKCLYQREPDYVHAIRKESEKIEKNLLFNSRKARIKKILVERSLISWTKEIDEL